MLQRQCNVWKKRYILLHTLTLSCFLSLFSVATPNPGSSLPSSTLPAYNIDASGEEVGNIPLRAATAIDHEIHEDWRQSLPPGLRNEKGAPLHRIFINEGVVLYLLGSSHVSRTSCEDAKLLMEHARPDVLFVELCSQRAGLLLSPTSSERDEQPKRNEDEKAMTPISQRGSLLFAKIQADYAKKLNVTIGGEFRQAFQSALSQQRQFRESQQSSSLGRHDPYFAKYPSASNQISQRSLLHPHSVEHIRGNRPCATILGDRPVRITLLRAWESLRFVGKLKLMVALLWSSIRKPSEKELREWMESILNDRSGKNDLITKSMEELGKAFPSLKRVIIEERDEFMVAKLRQIAEGLMRGFDQDEKIIVAVVGAGHCPGMLEKLMQKDEMCSEDKMSSIQAPLDTRPENILPGLLETKKRKISNDAEISSLVYDVIQFDYSCVL